jgi:hypothetical protein
MARQDEGEANPRPETTAPPIPGMTQRPGSVVVPARYGVPDTGMVIHIQPGQSVIDLDLDL